MGANASSGSNESPASSNNRAPSGYNVPLGHYGAHHKAVTPTGTNEHIAVVTRDKKKRMTGFATLRKKLIRRRRTSKSYDHAKILRDFVSDWNPLELNALVEEYEALAALKDLAVQAELARPPASTYKQDLSDLFDFKYCTDVDLVFQGAVFPVHRALLSSRCAYFRNLLAKWPGHGVQIQVDIRNLGIDIPTFSALLRYLYTGELTPDEQLSNIDMLLQLGDEFGLPNPLEHDLRYLLETGDYADAVLVFTSDRDYQQSVGSDYGFHHRMEVPCHKAILSARSQFFRSVIQRRTRSGEDYTERALHIPTKIVLDESVIPKRYARVLLQAVYLDTVDLGSILHASGSAGSLGEAHALTHGGRVQLSLMEEAMELYQIGRFLELDILAQGCEDLIIEALSLENLVHTLRWSDEPHGSSWVWRQAMHFLREEFISLSQSNVLFDLDKIHLVEALQSDFLQANELEILQAVLRWGEQQLVRRLEEREPNILNHTAHSVAKKGVKKRDLSDLELREVLADVLINVRMDHVIPPNNEVLTGAIKRGLVSSPPSHMIGDERIDKLRVHAWVRCQNNNGLYIRPRLFMPYFEEAKLLLSHQLVQQMELVRLRRVRAPLHNIPDTLYMVEEPPNTMRDRMSLHELTAVIPVPDTESILAMLKREQRLRTSPAYQRAWLLPLSSRHQLHKHIWLRVVREFGLPDSVADVLEGTAYCYNTEEVGNSSPEENHTPMSSKSHILTHSHPQLSNVPNESYAARSGTYPGMELPQVIMEGRGGELESSSCSDGRLSDIVPDVAMATASFSQLHLLDQQELELDLGDGAEHRSMSGSSTTSMVQNYSRLTSSGLFHRHHPPTASYHPQNPPCRIMEPRQHAMHPPTHSAYARSRYM